MSRFNLWLVIVLLAVPGPASAATTAAATSGGWSSAATWTNGVPGPNDTAAPGRTSD